MYQKISLLLCLSNVPYIGKDTRRNRAVCIESQQILNRLRKEIMMARNELWLTVLAVSSVGIIKDKSWCNKVIQPTTNTVKTHGMRWLKRALLVSIENST